MHGTNGVSIEDNVAFDTFGHCYMTEDGVEHSNHFLRNLGAFIKDADRLLDEASGRKESDDIASVFWMTTMDNHL
jgi:cell migration-inducing and hyaluronan-binding protein